MVQKIIMCSVGSRVERLRNSTRAALVERCYRGGSGGAVSRAIIFLDTGPSKSTCPFTSTPVCIAASLCCVTLLLGSRAKHRGIVEGCEPGTQLSGALVVRRERRGTVLENNKNFRPSLYTCRFTSKSVCKAASLYWPASHCYVSLSSGDCLSVSTLSACALRVCIRTSWTHR